MSGGTEEYQQNETELKQRFLREKIMDEGYSADEFVEFLEKRRDDGSNIEVWTFKELMWEVEEFKEYLKPRSNGKPSYNLFRHRSPTSFRKHPKFYTQRTGKQPQNQCHHP